MITFMFNVIGNCCHEEIVYIYHCHHHLQCDYHNHYHNLTLHSRCRRRGNRTLSEPNVKLSPPLICFLNVIIVLLMIMIIDLMMIVLLMIMLIILLMIILMMIMNLNLTTSIQSGQGGVLPGERIILDHKI